MNGIINFFLKYAYPYKDLLTESYLFYYKLYLLALLTYLLIVGSKIIYTYRQQIKELAKRRLFKKMLKSLLIIAFLFLIFYGNNHLIFFTDDIQKFTAAKDFIISGKNFPADIISYTYLLIFKITSSTTETAIVFFSYLLLSITLALQLKIIRQTLKDRFYSYLVFAVVIVLHLSFDEFKYNDVNYMFYGYFFNTLALFLVINFYNNKKFSRVFFIVPPIIMLAMLYRQENIAWLPFIVIAYYLDKNDISKKVMLITLLAIVLFIPTLLVQYKDEIFLNKKAYTHNIVEYLQSADASNGNLVREIEDANNPSLKNYYYNLKYRSLIFKVIFSFFVLSLWGIVSLKKYGKKTILALVIFSCLYFLLIFSQKFSVGHFKRFYPYLLFPYIVTIFYFIKCFWQKIKTRFTSFPMQQE